MNKFEDMFTRFDRIRTDGRTRKDRTDGHRTTAQTALMHSIARQELVTFRISHNNESAVCVCVSSDKSAAKNGTVYTAKNSLKIVCSLWSEINNLVSLRNACFKKQFESLC